MLTGELRVVFLAFHLFCLGSSQVEKNQGVRIASSPLGPHAGRVEVKYNGRWGTVCENGWSNFDADVICRMLNYTEDICAVRGATDVFGEGTGNVWLTNLQCGSRDETLDDCRNSDPHSSNPCAHSRDGAIICQDPSVMPVPYDITQLNTTTRSVLLGWKLDFIPPYIRAIDFRLNVSDLSDSSGAYRSIFFRSVVTEDSRNFSYTITSLTINTSYVVTIKAEGEYQWCSYNELVGKVSAPLIFTTADSIPPSTLPIRLVPLDTTRPYTGRLQVMYNGIWGNVCDDLFSSEDADVACWSLNYTDGSICYATNPFPEASARILLDNVDCRNADRFEDCIHNGWGVHDCSASESVGLICNPGPSGLPAVTGLRVAAISPDSITIEWDAVPNVVRYRIWYQPEGSRPLVTYVRSSTRWTLRRLLVGTNYTINVSASVQFRNFRGGNCFARYLYGDYSDPVYAIPKESAPTIAITHFHITILNATSVEVTWSPPSSTTIGVNGLIRGYKLYVDKVNGNRTVIDVDGGDSRVYLVTDLEESTKYFFSILMYTVEDGPLSVRLPVTMPNSSFIQLISKFGAYGDGIEVKRASTYSRGFNVLCGSLIRDATFEWKFSNGSSIGISNPGFRAAVFENGTAVLQIGTALPTPRRLTTCDGGVYTCVATHPDGHYITRNFSLQVGLSQPTLTAPKLIRRGSTWVQIGWSRLDCDGGYPLSQYLVEYRSGSFFSSYDTVASVTSLNYTIRGLLENREYDFRVGRESTESSTTTYSRAASIYTLEIGPSPPRDVSVTPGYNGEVCVSWNAPATPVGTVILYKLYAEMVDDSQEPIEAVDLPVGTLVKSFPGAARSGCMALSVTGIIYHFQMSAVVVINGDNVEGTLSAYSHLSTVFVPVPGIPMPVDIRGSVTNTSVTLQWKIPGELELDDAYYNVSYSGVVEWTSPAGIFTSFREQGCVVTTTNSSVLSPLTPSTTYMFTVVVVKNDEQRGPEASASFTTDMETGGKLAYFQVRIQNIGDCVKWIASDAASKLSKIKDSLQQSLFSLCQCPATLSQGEFSCRTKPFDTVIYRARLIGTSSQSVSDIKDTFSSWVTTNMGSVKIDESRYNLDPTCDPNLENIHGPDCVFEEPTTKPTSRGTEGVTQKVVRDEGGGSSNGGASAADVVGILLGSLVLGLLIALVAAVFVIIAFWWKKHRAHSFKSQSAFRELENQPRVSYTDLDKTEDENL